MPRTVIILLVLGALVFLAGGYLLFTPDDGSAVSVENTPASEAELAFLALTAQIDPVAFTTNILSDPRFMMLQDIRIAIIPEATGRPDPFAPIPGVPLEE